LDPVPFIRPAVLSGGYSIYIAQCGRRHPWYRKHGDYGGPARYTNIVFAEDEEGFPGLGTLNVSTFGYPMGQHGYGLSGSRYEQHRRVVSETAETALSTLHNFAKMMGVPN